MVDMATPGVRESLRNGSKSENADEASRVGLIELDRDWTQRRLETFRSLDKSTHSVLGQVFETAQEVLRSVGDMRQEMEQEARKLLHSVHGERDRLVEEIRDLRMRREDLTSEISAARRTAEEEIARLRRGAEEAAAETRRAAEEAAAQARLAAEREATQIRAQAETDHATMLREAEARRAELMAEIQDLEDQIADVSSHLHALVDRRGGALAPRGSRAKAVSAAPPARAARPEPERRAPTPPAPPVPPRSSMAVVESEPIRTVAPPPAHVGVATAVAERTLLTVRDVPSLAWALEFQRALQNAEGVEGVEARQFEDGVLVLAVRGADQLDLLGLVDRLPAGGLRLLSQDGDQMELSADND